jgi:hypothetical protein
MHCNFSPVPFATGTTDAIGNALNCNGIIIGAQAIRENPK